MKRKIKIQSKIFNNDYKVAKLIKLTKTGKYSAPRLAKIFNCNKKTVFRVLEKIKIRLPNLEGLKRKFFVMRNSLLTSVLFLPIGQVLLLPMVAY